MPLRSFDELHQDADALGSPLTVAVVGGADATVLEALSIARQRRWITPRVAGVEADIRLLAAERGLELDGFTILDTDDAAAAAVAEVRAGRAQLLMKGQVATPALMRAVLHPELGLRTDHVICQVVLMEIRSGGRFLLADTGVCIAPTLPQQCDILRSAICVARVLGSDRPRVAVMAATDSVNDAMPETKDAAELQRRGQSGDFGTCDVQGPLSFDLAYTADAGDKKRIGGPVVGAAEVLLFPSLLAANLTVKAIMYTAECRFGGVLCGVGCPVVFMSRADSTVTRLNSLALAVKLAVAHPTK